MARPPACALVCNDVAHTSEPTVLQAVCVLVVVPLACDGVHHLVFGLALGRGEVSASSDILCEEFFRLVRVVVQSMRPDVGDRDSDGSVGGSSDPLLPEVGVFAP